MSADKEKEPTEAANAFAILSDFKPKPAAQPLTHTKEIQEDISLVAKENGFHSREAKPEPAPKTKRFNAAEPKKQLNIKIPLPMHDRYYRMAEERGIKVLYELLGMGLDAIEEKEAKAAENKE